MAPSTRVPRRRANDHGRARRVRSLISDEATITLTRTTPASAATAEFTIPRQLGAVHLVRELGRGGMGVVWLGHHSLLSRDVAVKFLLNATAGPDDGGFIRFIEGARAAAAVRHPGLTTIHHADLVADVPYLVMEYVKGPTLAQLRKTHGALSLSVTLAVLEPVADAVGALHERGIVHQDIKPANVLLDIDGRAFVTDFGLAHARTNLQAAALGESLAGTPGYMAPEMLSGQVSVRSDVYALGIATYELLCGELPFRGTVSEIQAAHRDRPMPIEQLRRRNLNARLIEVIERATHKDALFRHKTAQHYLRALRQACPDIPPTPAGQRKLATLVAHSSGGTVVDDSTVVEPTPGDYYNTLATRAAAKRGDTPSTARTTARAPAARPASPSMVPVLVEHLPCVRCGYTLLGRPADDDCPECALPVGESLRPSRLLFADARWLRGLERGLRFLREATAYWSVLPVYLFLLMRYDAVQWIEPVGAVALMSLGLVSVVGLFRTTPHEPNGSGFSVGKLRQWSVRATGVGAITLGAATWFPGTEAWGRLACLALSLLTAALFCWHLAKLADRFPDARLARRTRVEGGLFALLAILVPAMLVPGDRAAVYAANRMALAAIFAATPIWILAWLLLGSYRRALEDVLSRSVRRQDVLATPSTDVGGHI